MAFSKTSIFKTSGYSEKEKKDRCTWEKASNLSFAEHLRWGNIDIENLLRYEKHQIPSAVLKQFAQDYKQRLSQQELKAIAEESLGWWAHEVAWVKARVWWRSITDGKSWNNYHLFKHREQLWQKSHLASLYEKCQLPTPNEAFWSGLVEKTTGPC